MPTPAKGTDKKTSKVTPKPTKKPAALARAPAKTVAKATPAKPAAGVKAKSPAKEVVKVAPVTSAATVNAKAAGRREAPQRKDAILSEQRRNYVEVAAYHIAERHGFTAGRESADWEEAEAEIDRLLAEGRLNP